MLTGHAVILLIGFVWRGCYLGFEGTMDKVYPLLPGMYLKIAIGTLMILGANFLMRKIIISKSKLEY